MELGPTFLMLDDVISEWPWAAVIIGLAIFWCAFLGIRERFGKPS